MTMWEGFSDSHMKRAILEHRWELIVELCRSRPTRGPVRPLSIISRASIWLVLWSAEYRILFVRRFRSIALLAGESTSGWEAKARSTKALSKLVKPAQIYATRLAFIFQERRLEGQCRGIVERFFVPLGFRIKVVLRLCGIVEIV